MTVADTVCVPTAHLTWFGEEYITGSCQVCPVTDSEFSFSFCDEGDVIVGQNMYFSLGQEFPGILQINDIYPPPAPAPRPAAPESRAGPFPGLTLPDGSKVREKAAPYNSE